MTKNKNLKKFYDGVYLKGEKKHYSNFTVSYDPLEIEKTILKEINWKNKRVVDVGCGTGLFAFMAAKKGAKVLGIDYSESAIHFAKKKYSHKNLEFKNADFNKEVKDQFDIVVSIGTLEHFDNPLRTLKKFKQFLKPNGKIIVTVPNWSNPRGHVLMTLYYLFNAPITLADLHYLTPQNFEIWAKELDLKLNWKTLNHSWAHGDVMVRDLKRRLPKVLYDVNIKIPNKNIKNLLKWLKIGVLPFEEKSNSNGAMGYYVFSLKTPKSKIKKT